MEVEEISYPEDRRICNTLVFPLLPCAYQSESHLEEYRKYNTLERVATQKHV